MFSVVCSILSCFGCWDDRNKVRGQVNQFLLITTPTISFSVGRDVEFYVAWLATLVFVTCHVGSSAMCDIFFGCHPMIARQKDKIINVGR
jgi:hypothetical protein